MTYNPKIKNTSKDDMSIDANIDANNVTMGEAEDGDWTDGIFAFDTETNVGTAIDKINELLKGLAPKVPSDLTNLSTTTPATDVRFADDIPMEAFSDRSKVFQLGSYKADPSTNFQRLGAYNSKEEISPITLTLNGDKSADSQTTPEARTNLAAGAFRVVADKQSTFEVYVNDQTTPKYQITVSVQGQVVSLPFLDSAGVALVGDDTSISLTEVKNGTFLSTGEEFALFQHRTGTVTIANNYFVHGFNYIKVTHQIEGESDKVETNYVEFICDKPTTRAGVADVTQQTEATFSTLEKVVVDETIKNGETKYLSGIAYYPGVSDCYYLLEGNVGNFTSTIYSDKANGGIKKSVQSKQIQGGASLEVSHEFDNRAYVNETNDVGGIKFTENEYHFHQDGQPVKVSIPPNSRILNDSPDVTIALENVFDTTSERGQGVFSYGENIMFDNFAANSTELIEEFDDEDYRINTTSDRTSTTPWNSQAQLTTNDLVVQGGVLKSISRASETNSPVQTNSLPSVIDTDDAYYYRKFVNSNAIATGRFKIKTGGDLSLRKRNDNEYYFTDNTIGDDAVEIHILDASNAWKSILSTTDGVYAQNKGVPTLNSYEFEIGFDLSTQAIPAPNATLVMRIATKQNLKGFIERIEVIPE